MAMAMMGMAMKVCIPPTRQRIPKLRASRDAKKTLNAGTAAIWKPARQGLKTIAQNAFGVGTWILTQATGLRIVLV